MPSGQGSKQKCVEKILAFKKGEYARGKIAKSLQKNKNKQTRPKSVTCEGTLYRVILTITHPSTRETYLSTMSKRTRHDLDGGKIPYEKEWKELVELSHDENCDELETLGNENKNFAYGASDSEPAV